MECYYYTVNTFHNKEITLHLNKLLSVLLESTHQIHGLRKTILKAEEKLLAFFVLILFYDSDFKI